MINMKLKRFLALGLCAIMIFSTIVTINAKEDNEQNTTSSVTKVSNKNAKYTKNENVYVKLNSDGTGKNAYVVNHFQVSDSGNITDYGNYSNVTNLTNENKLTSQNSKVNFSSDKGNFYYQGNIDSVDLPWNFKITYKLNNKSISPKDLGGKNGDIKINFTANKNSKVNSVFSENYVMQISLTLDNDKCSNIISPDATIVDAGNNTQLTFTVLPNENAKFTIKAKVKNFTMSGFSIAAIPYSVNIDTDTFNTDDFTKQISKLSSSVDKLNKGANGLLSGIKKIDNGSTNIVNGSSQIKDGLLELSNQSNSITNASSKFSKALTTISTQLSSADFSELTQLSKLPNGLSKLSKSLKSMKSGLVKLEKGFGKSYTAMDNAIQNSATSMPTQEELIALQKVSMGNQDALSGYQKLLDSYKQLQTIIAIWDKTKPAFQAINNIFDSKNEKSVINGLSSITSALDTMTNSLSTSLSRIDIKSTLSKLSKGIATLSKNYTKFDNGLSTYMLGVKKLSSNYNTFDDGLSILSNGTNSLLDGATSYSKGMNSFANGIKDMPNQIEDTIKEMMSQYTSKDFKAISFVDKNNTYINSVQFVISTDGIELPKKKTVKVKEQKQGFIDRFIALFK